MLLRGLCSYNYNHIGEVLQINPMTDEYDQPLSTDYSAENNVPEKIINVTVFAVISIRFR